MANVVLPIVARTRRGFPQWVDQQISLGHEIALSTGASINATTKGNLLLFGARENYWSYFPIATDLPPNNVEVLIKISKSALGDETFNNTGGAIMLSPSKNTGVSGGYAFSLGSGTSSACSVYDRPVVGDQERIGLAGINPSIATTSATILVRVRRVVSSVQMKVWHDGENEPTTWNISEVNTKYDIKNIGFIIHGRNLIINLIDIAYATNGDTASFDLPPVVDVIAGTVLNAENGDIVNIHDVETHDIVDSIILPKSGVWTSSLYDDRPVYARIERASGSEYDLVFAKYGNSYLGGDYPDGALKDDGVPSAGEVSVLYRSDDPILGGVTIAKTNVPDSGEWRVSGLQPNLPFDVVARKTNRRDSVVSNVVGLLDPDFKFSLIGQLSNVADKFSGLLLAKGATPPVTASFIGTVPYGLGVDDLAINGTEIRSNNLPLRDYGDFSFDVRVTDASNKTVDSKVSIINGERAPFIDLIATVNSMDRGNVTTPITAVIPSTVMPGDMLVIGLMRRGSVTVSDNNTGEWTLGADAFGLSTDYEQGTSIYYRVAKIGDAGKTITVSAPYNGRLIVYLSIYRGRFAQLKVKESYSSPLRYDATYEQDPKNLQPITHSSGFLVRAVSHVYALTGDAAKTVISKMTSTGSESGEPKRLQVAYKHLAEPGVFETTYTTGTTSSLDVIPDVAIIIDEVRP